jgi:lycopene cyclase CruA
MSSSVLEQIAYSHPSVYRALSILDDGERHLQRIMEIDRYWQIPSGRFDAVVKPGSELPAAAVISAEYDLVYAGGTLSLLHAAVMAKRYGRNVLVFDRHSAARSTRDWNISRNELLRLVETGVYTSEELDSVIVRNYKAGWVEFYKPDGKQKRLYMQNVLDCAVDADRLLGIAKSKVLSGVRNSVLDEVTFKACYRFPGYVVVETEDRGGRRLYYKAKVLVDVMGVLSPIARQLNEGHPQTHVCPTVGTIASGFEQADFDTGEILASTGPADTVGGRGRQFIWEGFPAEGDQYITYLFFYDEVDSPNDKTLLGLFETYFRTLPEYKHPGKQFVIHRPVYGIIPAYFHDGFNQTRVIADDRIILLGDAASLASPLTFCGLGSMIRNMQRMTEGLDRAMREDSLGKEDLAAISAYEPNVASMANLMKYMCFNSETDEPNFVNDMMNEVMIVLDQLPPRYREAMFRDEMRFDELVTVMLRVAVRYPKILLATWQKLGVQGSAGFLKNLAGWVFSSTK